MPRRCRRWRSQFTRSEYYRGWAFFALYLLVFPIFLARLQRELDQRLDFFLPPEEFSLIYYFILLCVTVLLFWSFLRDGFDALLDNLPENLTGFAGGFAGAAVFTFLFRLLPLPIQDPNDLLLPEQYAISPKTTVVILVVLMPIIEEVLFRGLLFGSIRRYSPLLAYAVTVLGYALFCVVNFVPGAEGPDFRYLLLLVEYLPMSLALTWCYDYGGSIWASVVLHMALKGAALFYAVQ